MSDPLQHLDERWAWLECVVSNSTAVCVCSDVEVYFEEYHNYCGDQPALLYKMCRERYNSIWSIFKTMISLTGLGLG